MGKPSINDKFVISYQGIYLASLTVGIIKQDIEYEKTILPWRNPITDLRTPSLIDPGVSPSGERPVPAAWIGLVGRERC